MLKIALIPGDGIGPEVMDVCRAMLDRLCEMDSSLQFEFTELGCGASQYRDTGCDINDGDWDVIQKADAILLGATGLSEVKYPDGTEVDTPITLREKLKLTASLRPAQSYDGVPATLAGENGTDIDLVVIRETTEGLFAGRNEGSSDGSTFASNVMTITRAASERLFELTFDLARERKRQGYKGKVTLVDKANVVSAFAFFRKIFYETAEKYPDIEVNHLHVDAASLLMIRDPHQFDVIVTENQYGDILSEIGAAVIGGLGLAPSADIGPEHAVFQPSHGSAPDITGKGIANPLAAVLSTAMMLEWLAQRKGLAQYHHAATAIREAVKQVLRGGGLTRELGGELTTKEVQDKLLSSLALREVAVGH